MTVTSDRPIDWAPPRWRASSEQTRAREPDARGAVVRDGVRVAWERFGDGSPTILLLPTWSVLHSRFWKGQIPYLARHFRVVTFDGRGNGRSDRPTTVEAYADHEFVADALAVLDATGTDQVIVVGFSMGCGYALRMAAEHPDRVLGAVFIGAAIPIGAPRPDGATTDRDAFESLQSSDEGWAKYNAHFWRRDWAGFAAWFSEHIFSEPHSTKPIEDSLGWFLETDAATIILKERAPYLEPPPGWGDTAGDESRATAFARRVRCPALVIHGDDDRIIDSAAGRWLAAQLEAPLVTIGGGGHSPLGREPVLVNRLIRRFVMGLTEPRSTRDRGDPKDAIAPSPVAAGAGPTWTRSLRRRRRALYISSPIGLGHAHRDAAIAAALRRLHPDLQIDWLAQHPVTDVLAQRGERIHPASAWLASESGHITAESSGHSLHAFQAIRRMDEILVANFMVFHDVIEDGEYDLVIGDEAWDVDYYLHENPEIKRTAFAWLTDFVGWLPMPTGGEHEAFLTADYNAEMIEHIARLPRIRDRAVFVGDPDDIVPDAFGPGLPRIRDWTERHFDFSGYITGFDPAPLAERRPELRRELGYRDDERVVIVTVGGSGVGETLLRRVLAAYPDAARQVPGLRMIAVAGPRIEPERLAAPDGVEVRAFVPDLYQHLAACDIAVVQGGLTTTMELVAARRPFLYFPLADHFEQTRHVRHRLDRYGAGRCLDYATASPEVIAEAIRSELDRPIDYRPVATDGAERAAALIAPLL